MYILKKLDTNRMIKTRLNNYVTLPQNGRLMHIDPKLYTKCPLGIHDHVNMSH